MQNSDSMIAASFRAIALSAGFLSRWVLCATPVPRFYTAGIFSKLTFGSIVCDNHIRVNSEFYLRKSGTGVDISTASRSAVTDSRTSIVHSKNLQRNKCPLIFVLALSLLHQRQELFARSFL